LHVMNWDTGQSSAQSRPKFVGTGGRGKQGCRDGRSATQLREKCPNLGGKEHVKVSGVTGVERLGKFETLHIYIEASKKARNWSRAEWNTVRQKLKSTDWNRELT
jgi:hypothetical protein